MKDGEERVIKKRRKKQDGGILEDKKPRKNKVPKPGLAFNFSSVCHLRLVVSPIFSMHRTFPLFTGLCGHAI